MTCQREYGLYSLKFGGKNKTKQKQKNKKTKQTKKKQPKVLNK